MMPRPRCLSAVCALVVLGTSTKCSSAIQPASAQAAPMAPNESIVTAQVTTADVVESTTLGIEPSQKICVLTLKVLSTAPGRYPLPAVREAGVTITSYGRQPECDKVVRGTTITAALTLRGGGKGERLWLVRLIEPPKPPPSNLDAAGGFGIDDRLEPSDILGQKRGVPL